MSSDQLQRQQQPDPSTQGSNSRAIGPLVGAVGDDPHDGNDSTIAGQQQAPPDFDLDTSTEETYTPSPSSISSSSRVSNSEILGALSLDPDQSTPPHVNLSHAMSERASTFERRASFTSSLPDLEQPDLDGDQMSVGSSDGNSSDISSLEDVGQGPPLPQAPVYNSDLQDVLRQVKEHLSSIKSDMERSPLIGDRESDFFNQYEQVHMSSQLNCPETRTVGFIGNSGVGKSRLINSLLDLEGLARSVCQ